MSTIERVKLPLNTISLASCNGGRRSTSELDVRLPHIRNKGWPKKGSNGKSVVGGTVGRKSVSDLEKTIDGIAAFLRVKVIVADMPESMQVHAFRCARRSYDCLEKFSTRQIAHDIKKEFDNVYGSV